MPTLFDDIRGAFQQVLSDSRGGWEGLPLLTRLIIAIALAGLSVYLGSRSERTAVSLTMYAIAFGSLAYVISQGMGLMQ